MLQNARLLTFGLLTLILCSVPNLSFSDVSTGSFPQNTTTFQYGVRIGGMWRQGRWIRVSGVTHLRVPCTTRNWSVIFLFGSKPVRFSARNVGRAHLCAGRYKCEVNNRFRRSIQRGQRLSFYFTGLFHPQFNIEISAHWGYICGVRVGAGCLHNNGTCSEQCEEYIEDITGLLCPPTQICCVGSSSECKSVHKGKCVDSNVKCKDTVGNPHYDICPAKQTCCVDPYVRSTTGPTTPALTPEPTKVHSSKPTKRPTKPTPKQTIKTTLSSTIKAQSTAPTRDGTLSTAKPSQPIIKTSLKSSMTASLTTIVVRSKTPTSMTPTATQTMTTGTTTESPVPGVKCTMRSGHCGVFCRKSLVDPEGKLCPSDQVCCVDGSSDCKDFYGGRCYDRKYGICDALIIPDPPKFKLCPRNEGCCSDTVTLPPWTTKHSSKPPF